MEKAANKQPGMKAASTLPFDPETLAQGIRVKPAQFARMCSVSKQCVSQWIKAGKISLFPDGTLDPAAAARDIINFTDPSRMRAKVFKVASDDAGVLRKEIARLDQVLVEANARIEFLEMYVDEGNLSEEIFNAMLMFNADELRAADIHQWADILERLWDAAVQAAGADLEQVDPETGLTEPRDMGGWRKFMDPDLNDQGALTEFGEGAGNLPSEDEEDI